MFTSSPLLKRPQPRNRETKGARERKKERDNMLEFPGPVIQCLLSDPEVTANLFSNFAIRIGKVARFAVYIFAVPSGSPSTSSPPSYRPEPRNGETKGERTKERERERKRERENERGRERERKRERKRKILTFFWHFLALSSNV